MAWIRVGVLRMNTQSGSLVRRRCHLSFLRHCARSSDIANLSGWSDARLAAGLTGAMNPLYNLN
jgi:hypothetical protein